MEKIYFTLPSGNVLYFNQPEKVPILREDIYLGLKRKYRYLGFLPVTVIQHLCVCKRLAEAAEKSPMAVAYCAVHDFHEAYIGEWVTGFKQLLPDFMAFDKMWENHVLKSLGFVAPVPDAYQEVVEQIDRLALAVETTTWDSPDSTRVQQSVGMPSHANLTVAEDVLTRRAEKWQRLFFNEVWDAVYFRGRL